MPRAPQRSRLAVVFAGSLLLAASLAPVARAGAASTLTLLLPSEVPEAHSTFNVAARVDNAPVDDGGTMTFSLDGVAIDGCVAVDVGDDNRGFCQNLSLEEGQYTIKAEYSGTATIDPSNAETTLTIGPDLVHAAAFYQYATFYPVSDGYRDSVILSGERYEPSTATVRIYSPEGTLIKTVAFAQAATPFGFAWNGRFNSGALRAAGKYKVTWTLVDAFGTTAIATAYVYLSHKKLIWHTQTLERTGKS